MATPEEIATEIVDRFSWSSNVMREGRLVGQQVLVAEAIAQALKDERERCAAIPERVGRSLVCGRRRTNQVDRHTSEVLMRMGEKIRNGDQ